MEAMVFSLNIWSHRLSLVLYESSKNFLVQHFFAALQHLSSRSIVDEDVSACTFITEASYYQIHKITKLNPPDVCVRKADLRLRSAFLRGHEQL